MKLTLWKLSNQEVDSTLQTRACSNPNIWSINKKIWVFTTNNCTHYLKTTLQFSVWKVHSLRQGGEGCNCLWHQTFSLRWISEGEFLNFHKFVDALFPGRCICEVEDRDSEDAGANTGGFQTQVRPGQWIKSIISPIFQEWNLHKDRAADDHQDDQDNNPAVAAGRLGSTLMARSSICTIINTFIFVITYPNLTKMKRHVWYWCLSRVPVIFLTKCLRSPHLTTLCDTDRKALIKSNSVTDVE